MENKNEQLSWFEKIINHESFWVLALSTLLIPQIASSVQVFAVNNVQYKSPWFAWCYAIGIDLTIIIFTIKGKLKVALIYLVIMLAHALVGQFYPEKSTYGMLLVHTTLPITIFSFSHLFYAKKKARENTANNLQLTAQAAQLATMVAQGIRIEPQAHICPQCGIGAATAKKLNGHISGHKQKDEWHPESYGAWEKENEQRAAALTQLTS